MPSCRDGRSPAELREGISTRRTKNVPNSVWRKKAQQTSKGVTTVSNRVLSLTCKILAFRNSAVLLILINVSVGFFLRHEVLPCPALTVKEETKQESRQKLPKTKSLYIPLHAITRKRIVQQSRAPEQEESRLEAAAAVMLADPIKIVRLLPGGKRRLEREKRARACPSRSRRPCDFLQEQKAPST